MKLSTILYIATAVYILVINIIGFTIMGLDKQKARNMAWRIPEADLFVTALLGGSIGSLIGMFFFHHKTKHLSFLIGMPLILLIQIGLVLWFLFKSPFTLLII